MIMNVVPERQQHGFYNIHEAAQLLNVRYQTIRQNVRRGDVPRPSHLIGRRYYYTANEVETLAEIFTARKRYKNYQAQ